MDFNEISMIMLIMLIMGQEKDSYILVILWILEGLRPLIFQIQFFDH